MDFDNSLFEADAGYYEMLPGRWMAGKFVENGTFTFSRKAVDAATSVELRDDDVIIATYPKTGQTWSMAMIRLILQASDLERGSAVQVADLFQKIPFIEIELPDGSTGADIFSNLESPRFMKTHLPLQLWMSQLEKHPDLKIIQTLRNPKDTLVSYYHHLRSDVQLGPFGGSWDQFFELYKRKQLPFGDYFQHNSEWYKFHQGRTNSLILPYEDIKSNPHLYVKKIAEFLGIQLSESILNRIVEETTIEKMKKDVNPVVEVFAGWKPERSSLIRKGKVGGWVEYFSGEQSEYVDKQYEEYLEPLGLKFRFE